MPAGRLLVNRVQLSSLLAEVQTGSLTIPEALERLAAWPFQDVEGVRVDTHRSTRSGAGEVIFGAGKTPEELLAAGRAILAHEGRLLITRVAEEHADALCEAFPGAVHHARARCLTVGLPAEDAGEGDVLVVSAGTADAPVAEEAWLTARMHGAHSEVLRDVGVAGVHRALAEVERLRRARVLVVVAGMEGALPSLIGGLVAAPVVAVPTSTGYGASLGGLAALLGMLNSCATGVTVVNIDNGFGAGAAAARMNRLAVETTAPTTTEHR